MSLSLHKYTTSIPDTIVCVTFLHNDSIFIKHTSIQVHFNKQSSLFRTQLYEQKQRAARSY